MSAEPQSPVQDPAAAALPRPSGAYRGRAWLAVISLIVFMILYLAVATWFVLTAVHLLAGPMTGDDALVAKLAGVCAAFLAIFMLKGLFFIKRGGMDRDLIEVTAGQQPQLFRFLHEIADSVRAPRPHRVFLSPRVNASVSYDLSLLNLLLPSRKNLEIGLGLVNILTREELRAVLAHEFGHFAQRSMAVGRWVYVAQQIAAHLVARRDRFDRFLAGLSRSDPRIAWIGWAVSLIVWALRALVDSAFRVVIVIQRALSRQMELNADLVAVQLTGSDALVHALHRLQAADDSWERATRFITGEHRAERTPEDAFAVQARILEHMRRVLDDPYYGSVAPVPADNPQAHRVFKAGLAQPPRMWLTHPLNYEREANAKRRYIPSVLDDASAWSVFEDTLRLRRQLTALMLGAMGAVPEPWEKTLARVDEQFSREYLNARYRGIYLGRSPVRHVVDPLALYESGVTADHASHAALYPANLTADMEQLRALELDLAQLRGLRAGTLRIEGGVIRHRDGEAPRSALATLLAARERELAALQKRLRAHDLDCRAWHAAAARTVGQGWPEYLEGLLRAVHYADHVEADLSDAHAWFRSILAVETASRRVGKAARRRVLAAAGRLYQTLSTIYDDRDAVRPGPVLGARMAIDDWPATFGKLELVPPSAQNLGNWLNALDGWVRRTTDLLSLLRNRALEELLVSEGRLAAHVLHQAPLAEAGTPPRVPEHFSTLLPGQERARQTRLSWWARFVIADGMVPAIARLAVAGGILGVVLGLGFFLDRATITIYNGLARQVDVRIGDTATVHVPPHGTAQARVPSRHGYEITASAGQQPIESFRVDVDAAATHAVYNVASASPLIEWTAVYGEIKPAPPVELGAPRWSTTYADYLFAEPPRTVSGNGPSTRRVLQGLGDRDPQYMLSMVRDKAQTAAMIQAHAAWDATSDSHILQWLALASDLPEYHMLLARRLRESPRDVVLRRMEVDTAPAQIRPALCEQLRKGAAALPDDAVAHYLAIRCMPDGPEQDKAYLDAHRHWPSDPWLANAAGYVQAGHAQWAAAQATLEQAARALPPMAAFISVDLARIARLRGEPVTPGLKSLFAESGGLQRLLALDTGTQLPPGPVQAYPALAHGNLEHALAAAKPDPGFYQHMLRLVAASDGATPAMVKEALAQDPQAGVDSVTVWATIGLAIREKHDYRPLLSRLAELSPYYGHTMQTLLESLARGKVDAHTVDGLPPEMRGQLYTIGVIAMGKHAPQEWRDGANALLFGSERPYFKGTPQEL
ncbi:MAG TPA: M48 family metallopeptidase [Bordetella sp.]|nr:M48 family metallopeptidase [Bordetella sp.]